MLTFTAQGSLTAQDISVTLDLAGCSAASIQANATFSGTITFEATADGTTWLSILGTKSSDNTASTTTTSAGLFFVSCPGVLALRARCSSYSSGAPFVTIRGVVGSFTTGSTA